MRVFFVGCKDVAVLQEYIDGWPRYERVNLCELIAAPTRGTAKSMFARAHRTSFTEISTCQFVAEDNLVPQVLPSNHSLWNTVEVKPW